MRTFIKKQEAIEKAISITAFCVMVVMTSINVFSRYIFSKSFAFAEEIAYMGFNWSVFIGVCRVFRSRGLVSVDVLVNRMPANYRKVAEIVVSLILLGTNAMISWYAVTLSVTGWSRRTSYLGIPYTFMYMPAAIAFVVMTVDSIRFVAEAVRALGDTEGGDA